MSWMQRLYETYEHAAASGLLNTDDRPLPPGHSTQQAQIEVTINGDGDFLRATIVPNEETLIPATEVSAGRTSGGEPHPLCDKIQYIAGDYSEFGGGKPPYFDDFKSGSTTKDGYLTLIGKWYGFSGNEVVGAVLKYVSKRRVVADLIASGILFAGGDGKLLSKWEGKNDAPEIFRIMIKKAGLIDQGDAFVRWRVEIPGIRESRVWKNDDLVKAWLAYYTSTISDRGLCFVTGETASLCYMHPAKLRHGGDGAKLISSNDTRNFTFMGRFTDASEACTVGYEVTQRAHNALRWLIARQSFRSDDHVVVAWEINNTPMPRFWEDTSDFFASIAADLGVEEQLSEPDYEGDFGQHYARRLAEKIRGYTALLDDRSEIVVLGLDSCTPGRMSVTFYRELAGSEFVKRLEDWHESYAWPQYYSKDKQFVGAPSPKDIATVAFGHRPVDGKYMKATVARILPCIVDGSILPLDLVRSAFNYVKNRAGKEYWEWEKALGIACGLYRGFMKKKEGKIYTMPLDTELKNRDYLYGRLLAAAEKIEISAQAITKEYRETNASRYMNRFADRPYSTWLIIEKSLIPYLQRVRAKYSKVEAAELLDSIHDMFAIEDYKDDSPLSGEFLLGYHSQRLALKSEKERAEDSENNTNEEDVQNVSE